MRRTFGDAFDFVIVREIAHGGMGHVYEALQCGVRGFSKRVALKVIKPELSMRQELRELFVAEAHLVADLVHENIVQIYHLGEIPPEREGDEVGARLYFSMEFIDGLPLESVIEHLAARGRRMAPDMAAFVASRVCRALEYAHSKCDSGGQPLGIVHRDVCPANVLIARGGVVKLSDFGVAKARIRAGRVAIPQDESQVLVGRARYMSPEAARFEGTDARSDVYSIGVVLYELLAGAEVFRPSIDGTGRARVRSLLPLRMVAPEVPERLEAIVMGALERDPARRHLGAGIMGLELERFMYEKGYGPTNLTLADFMQDLFPESTAGEGSWAGVAPAGAAAGERAA